MKEIAARDVPTFYELEMPLLASGGDRVAILGNAVSFPVTV